MEKLLKTKTKIRFQDCDPFNHLNNSKYLEYFINAREDQIAEHYGLDIFAQLENTGLSWMVLSNQINYFRPAHTMETVVIASQLLQYTEKILLVELSMWNETETELKALLWTKFIHFNAKEKKLAKHSDELMKLFEAVVIPVEQSIFEDRAMAVVKQLKSVAP